jgi:hypothetical protein
MLKVGKSLHDADVLWRYLSLDKFIDLVASRSLYFSPLESYAKTDRFEGYLPRVAMDAIASISRRFRNEQLAVIETFTKKLPPEAAPNIERMRATMDEFMPSARAAYQNVVACTMVNCWYKNLHESEGMWSLYSRNGVAIRATVGSLKAAIGTDESDREIHIGAVKYVDFSDESLKPSDCLTDDGHLMGMVKRIAYAHENEVRMCLSPERDFRAHVILKPASTRVSVSLDDLLTKVVISPFAEGALEAYVRAVFGWARLDETILSKSTLGDNSEWLLDAYN